MTDLDAILARIIAEPGEDTVRLAYADALDERGEPGDAERAEFVRVQVALALRRAEEPAGKDGVWLAGFRWGLHREGVAVASLLGGRCECAICLQNRSDELAAGADAWVPPVNAVWDWHRGFIADVTCTAADWLAHGDALRAAHPVTSVRLTTEPDWAAELIAGDGSPWHGMEHTDRSGDAFTCPRWPGVEFTLPPAPATGAGATVTVGGVPLYGLTRWEIAGADIPAGALVSYDPATGHVVPWAG